MRQAEEHIAEGERHVSRQRKIVAGLERDEHDTVLANELLETLETTLANHVAQRDRIAEELRQDDASAQSRFKE
ncbi:MAG TPA: hypothetical protein VGU20_18255 [Stellaceae bacterium]|nr:hypothetical protein [Stellaceae bacterium]